MILLWLLACGGSVHTYETSLLHIGTAYNAKMACSCLFVSDQDADHCKELLRVSPDVARFKVDDQAKVVTSKALGGWKRTARYVDAQVGCVIEE